MTAWGSPRGSVPIPAATVVPIRDTDAGMEVLLLRRSSAGAFGGMWVFPGGKVDEADGAGVDGSEAEELARARAAAVREAREEAGIELVPSSLVRLSFWLPPPEAPRRYATWFFIAPFQGGPDVVVDLGEIKEHRWLTPAAAMRLRDLGRIELAPPTFTTLWWLSLRSECAAAMSDAAASEPGRFETHVAFTSDGLVGATLWAGDAGYEDCDMEKPGPRRRLIMSPDGWRVEVSP